jgi:hypothetical protein
VRAPRDLGVERSMTVRNGTITLPPPATAAAREAERHRILHHWCATHLDGANGGWEACNAGIGCVALCGVDLRDASWYSGPPGPDDCVVCNDLYGGALRG